MLGLGELKPTNMVIQLVDRSTRLSRGIVEDVLIRGVEFSYPVNFVMIETRVFWQHDLRIEHP